ncbi:hypothetical protein INP51_07070 [Blautia liquoris]|jgi:ABC-type antimicrobial peptide transport system permease subunit|uniref:Uncharacterized protein n=1 Tax=Blautia liquoris TaxID=2779518 RepID=A0A7M2RK36_9FIRM|nr:hypothetical protein [Blautia liquoris]QOV20683.1 hypothetical protein INP51_07070 [Blautia liquoris]
MRFLKELLWFLLFAFLGGVVLLMLLAVFAATIAVEFWWFIFWVPAGAIIIGVAAFLILSLIKMPKLKIMTLSLSKRTWG